MQWMGANLAQSLYLPELELLVTQGDEVNVRGLKTKEVLNFATEVWEPWHHCILIPSRHWNPWLALSESLWILSGRNDVASLLPYNRHIIDYSDDGITLYGAYGRRIAEQIDPLVERLQADHSDRRAVLQIWGRAGSGQNPLDLIAKTKDPPCNNMVYFKIRDNKLHMTVMCRSNDLHFGLFAVNLPSFGLLQVYLASRLNVGVGTQTHFSNSLHIYTEGKRPKDITNRMVLDGRVLTYPQHEMAFKPGELTCSHSAMRNMCSDVLEGFPIPASYPPFLQFASQFLKQYRDRAWEPQAISQRMEYQDWMQAGEAFVNQVWK